MLENETWKEIKENSKSIYYVSNLGNVKRKNKKSGKIEKISPSENNCGYFQITIGYIHRLVAQAFVSNPENKPTVNHKDGNKKNNHADNLEWCTQSENTKHAFENNLICISEKMKKQSAENCKKSFSKKYTLEINNEQLNFDSRDKLFSFLNSNYGVSLKIIKNLIASNEPYVPTQKN